MMHIYNKSKNLLPIILVALLSLTMQVSKGQVCLVMNPATTGFTSTGVNAAFVGQSFTMNGCNSGDFTSVVVYSATDHTDVILRIYAGEGFGGTLLYQQTEIVLTGLVNFSLATEIFLNTPVPYVGGNVYTFQLDFPNGNFSFFQLAKTTTLDFYPDGTLYENNSSMNGQDLRFTVNTNSSALPVELVNFEAEIQNSATLLTWATATEINNRGFEIERSGDGKEWMAIDFVNGHGTSEGFVEYEYLDARPLQGMNYYRLRQIDFDGNEQRHGIKAVKFEGNTDRFQVYPNPVKSGQDLTIVATGNTSVFFVLSDMYGRPVWNNTIPENGVFTSPLPNNLPIGIYSLTLFSEGKKTSSLLSVH